LLNLGNAYSVRHFYEKALESWSLALRYANDVGNFHQQGQIHNNLGIAEFNQGHYENALQNYLKGIEIFTRLGNSPGLALCLSNVGEVYIVQSEYEKAFESWEECLDLYTNIDDAHGLAETYSHLSQVCLVFENFDIARDYLQKSRQIIENANLEAQWAIYYLCCSALALAEKKLSEAEQYVLQAKERFQSIGDDLNYCKLLLIGGRLQRQLGRHKESADYFTEALKKGVELKLPLWEAEALRELGIESREKDTALGKRALTYLKEAYDLIEHETVNDFTWKLCYDIGKEYSHRGLESKSKEFFVEAKQALLYLGSLYTRQSLIKRFWESDNRGAVLKEIEGLIEN
jgi:tetratricopeptide (TPR) repeat protein